MDTIERIYNSNKDFVENDNFKGVKKIIVDNYSDEAHFIYEMLQNADDAQAKEITFELREDKLVVSHNGIAFTENDLEGICSISKGTKSNDYTKIGKFGIGFKSVFVYTESPQVFSGNYQFEIRELVLPKKIDRNFDMKPDKTVFILPFNAKKTSSIAKERIDNKLNSLHEEAILFLKNIKKINFIVDDNKRIIEKQVLNGYNFYANSYFEHVRITKIDAQNEFDEEVEESSNYYIFKRDGITLFDKDDDGENVEVQNQSVMLAYLEVNDEVCAIDDDRQHSHEDSFFVFFPTRIPSNCQFFIHAPFITKSSRDTIALNNDANDELMKNIGILVADSMIVLRNENQLSVDLLERLFFNNRENGFGNKLIYGSFKEEYLELLHAKRTIVPCDKGVYRSLQSVLFTSENPDDCNKLIALFGIKWLSDFFGVQDATDICYVSYPSNYFSFIQESFNYRKLKVVSVVSALKAEFYESKESEWFAKYVSLLVEKNSYGSYKVRYENLDKCPLIRTKEFKHLTLAHADKVYLNNGTLDEKLLNTPSVNYLYRYVFKLREYSTELSDAQDAIRVMASSECANFDAHITMLRKVLIAIDNKKISSEDIGANPILYVVNQKTCIKRKVLPKDALVGRWERTNGTFDLYVLCKGVDIELLDQRYLDEFSVQELRKIGCKTDGLTFVEGTICDFFAKNGIKNNGCSTRHIRPQTGRANNRLFKPLYQFNNFDEILKAPMTINKSVIILRLAKEFDNQIKDWVEWSSRQDFSRTATSQGYDECYSLFGASLVLNNWMYDKDGKLVRPGDVTSDDLLAEYRRIMTADLADKLGIKKSSSEMRRSWNQKLESDGLFAIPIEEKLLYEEFRRQQAAKKAEAENWNQYIHAQGSINAPQLETHSIDYHKKYDQPIEDDTSSKSPIKDMSDIAKQTKCNVDKYMPIDNSFDEEIDIDQDEYTPVSIDESKRIIKAKQKNAAETEKLANIEKLKAKACNLPEYSYGWFTALIEMECINSGDTNANSREVSITFSKVERERETERTLVLMQPNRYIPHFMEDLADIPLVLHGDQKKTVAIEVVNIKSYTLRVKLKNSADIEGIELSSVTSATINAQSPSFLLNKLKEQFLELGKERKLEDNFDMQDNLCENIEFVFGPPGTGKTTHLAQNVLIPMMQNNVDYKVLVLTPTNKSADVLVRRIMEVSKDIGYHKWLVRFGTTGDEEIEQSPVFRDKTFDIRTLRRNVTVTTIARFPYDYFMPEGARIFLHGINWDYIVIDEASMIPIANIVFPLYKKTPRKFIIAGDPFQIEPITSVNLWKDKNIYTMVHLDSFTDPKTVPYQYKVELLTTQYRSVPDIGYVFSKFAYKGILQHERSAESQRPLNVGNDLRVETLNIIKFPVSKYESIYRCKSLHHSSSYQIYSALFTFEYVCYLSKAIAANNQGSLFKIGVIAPYRAQADMIDKLLASEKLPKEVDVQVGTIHGFQGDECDIIFAVFNTPSRITSSKDMFLNKRNIINVSISRARDYLFIVMPDDDTENITNLRLIKRVELLIHNTKAWNECLSPALESLMFGDSKYLENNAFSTSHQSVNVYGLPEKRYEVRTEDSAVDIQLHKSILNIPKDDVHVSDIAQVKKINSVVESSSLDLSLIPNELRKDAIVLPVRNAINGWCYLVPYNGKLKTHNIKPTAGMFIPQMRNGQEKMVSVSVIEEDRIIYISEDKFKLYEKGLTESEGIELRKTL